MDAYDQLNALTLGSELSINDFDKLQKKFAAAYLEKAQYFQRLSIHRKPSELKHEMMLALNQLLISMQQRPEMRDFDAVRNAGGYVPSVVKEIWNADKRLRTCYDAILQYCSLRKADVLKTLVHMAEYKAMYTIYRKIERSAIQKPSAIFTTNLKPLHMINKTVHPIHFDELSWSQFEWLIYAFVKRLHAWDDINWFGQLGHDEGEDIWGETAGKSYCYLCANYKSLTLKKGTEDIDKLVKTGRLPDHLIVVCGGKISAGINKGIKEYARITGIANVSLWSGADIEENLRASAPDLLKRFFEGVAFPEPSAVVLDDNGIINELAVCFDRPAFTTPFYREVNIPHFEKAITDTIEVLNTGIHRLRDGTVIRNIPNRHQIKNESLKKQVATIYKLVVRLRDNFFEFRRNKEIEPCGCNEPDCPVYLLSDNACQKMDMIRRDIFQAFREIKPDFDLTLDV